MLRLALLALTLLLAGCDTPTIFFFGGSVVWGTSGTANVTCAACPDPPGNCGCKEPGGGFPDKIKAAVAGRAHVGNRAIPSFTVAYFIARAGNVPAACTGSGCLEATYWPPFGVAGNPAYPYWTDVPVPALTPYGTTYAQSAALAGVLPASTSNRVCIAAVGRNDWFVHGHVEKFCTGTSTLCQTAATCDPGQECMTKSGSEYAPIVFARYQALLTSLSAVCPTMIVNTDLCGTDPGDGSCPFDRIDDEDGADYVRAYNNLIRTQLPSAWVFDMDAEVIARGGAAYTPFPDGVHPTCPVFKLMAEAQIADLIARDIIDSADPVAACP